MRLQDPTYGNYWNLYTEALGTASGSGNLLFVPNSGGLYAYIQRATGNYVSSSDARLKKDITPLGNVLSGVLQLEPVAYRFKIVDEAEPLTYGLLAQQVEPLFPSVVSEAGGYKGIAYSELVPVTIKALQELNNKVEDKNRKSADRIDRLESENAELKQANTALEKRLEVLEQIILKQNPN